VKLKPIAHSGYDHMTIVAEDKPRWWDRLLRRKPRVRTFKGEALYWEENGEAVTDRVLSAELNMWWTHARASADSRRNKARGK
jgi:hypothetical protein